MKHAPFALLQISQRYRAFHVMPNTLNSPNPRRCHSLAPSHACRLDSIVIVASADVILHLAIKPAKIILKFVFIDNICISTIEARVPGVVGDIQSFQSEVRIDADKKSVQPSSKISINVIKCSPRTYCFISGALCQSSGRFFPGCGHAGQRIAHSPSRVPATPTGSCPLPMRLSMRT